MRQTIEQRFWSYVSPEPMSGCWLWTGWTVRKGYGALAIGGRSARANRLSWEIHRGAIPEGLFVCHKCDVSACVNPDHLYLGSGLDNARDMTTRGRHASQKKTHCPQGHPYEGDNLRASHGVRRCRACGREHMRRYRAKTR